MPTKTGPSRFSERDNAILRLHADARIALHAIVGELFFAAQGGNGGHVIKRLCDEGLLEVFPRAITGGISYCRLTPRGATRVNAPKTRTGALNTAAFHSALAIAFWAYLAGPARRYRLDSRDVEQVLGSAAPRQNVPHVISDEFGHPAILRAYIAQGTTPDSVAKLRTIIDEADAPPMLRRWIADRDYGFAALAPSPEACKSLDAAIDRAKLRDRALVIVGLGPSPETLASALRQRKKGSS